MTRSEVFWWCLKRVPSVIWFGVRFKSLQDGVCTVTMRANWRNRNPYGDAYFAAVVAAAEMASGVMIFNEIRQHAKNKRVISAVIQSVEAKFSRPVRGDVDFICVGGPEISQAVLKEKSHLVVNITALNGKNKLVASVHIEWAFRRIK